MSRAAMLPRLVRPPSPATLAAVGRLRAEVWREEGMPVPDATGDAWTDRFDDLADHFVIAHEGVLVASGRLTVHADPAHMPDADHFAELAADFPRPVALMSRVVVWRAARRQGLATLIDEARIEAAHEAVAACIVTECSPPRVPALLRRGFVALRTRPGVRFPGVVWTVLRLMIG